MNAVSIVLPVLNEGHNVPGLLASLRQLDPPAGEVVVVDGGSTDDTRAVVEAHILSHPGLRMLAAPGVSTAAALNAGIRAARGEYVVRLDAHAVPRPDYVRRCLQAAEASGAEVVGGRWEIAPGGAGLIARAIALAVSHPLGAGDAAYRRAGWRRAGEVDTVPYGCFRKVLWERLGGFDESLRANEDYEFNYRVRRAGGRVYLDPAICSTYFARRTLSELGAQYFRYGWWKAQMLRRHPASIRGRQALPLAALGLLAVTAILAALSAWARAVLCAEVAGYAALLGAASLDLALRRRAGRCAVMLPLVFATVHFSWSVGAYVNWLTGGRWPR